MILFQRWPSEPSSILVGGIPGSKSFGSGLMRSDASSLKTIHISFRPYYTMNQREPYALYSRFVLYSTFFFTFPLPTAKGRGETSYWPATAGAGAAARMALHHGFLKCNVALPWPGMRADNRNVTLFSTFPAG